MKGTLFMVLGGLLMVGSLTMTYLSDILVPPAQTVNDLLYPLGGVMVLWGIKWRFGARRAQLVTVFVVFALVAIAAPFGVRYLEHQQLRATLTP